MLDCWLFSFVILLYHYFTFTLLYLLVSIVFTLTHPPPSSFPLPFLTSASTLSCTSFILPLMFFLWSLFHTPSSPSLLPPVLFIHIASSLLLPIHIHSLHVRFRVSTFGMGPFRSYMVSRLTFHFFDYILELYF